MKIPISQIELCDNNKMNCETLRTVQHEDQIKIQVLAHQQKRKAKQKDTKNVGNTYVHIFIS